MKHKENKIIKSIFATNLDLLEEPEVINLLNYVREEHEKLAILCKKLHSFKTSVADVLYNSKVCLNDGIDFEQSLKSIYETYLISEG